MSLLASLVVLLAAAPAMAQDDDDFLDDLFDEEEDEGGIPDERERTTDDEDDFGEFEEEDDESFFLDEEEEVEDEIRAGQDTASIYRAYQKKIQEYQPEEQIAAWEEYLIEYPFSVFQDQIEEEMDELGAGVYSERIVGPAGGGGDAMRQEIDLAVPLLLESIDPRSKLRAGLEIGFPSYLNLLLDGEYQIMRELSAHAGIRRRYTGWSPEIGVKYAPIKSTRTGTIVTGLLDLHMNTNPLFPAIRPQVGVGQVFKIGNSGGLHVQAQGGVDMEFWGDTAPTQFRYVGGANIFYHAAENVGVFAETSTNMKFPGDEQLGSFRFNVVTFGLRFVPGDSNSQIAVSANVPYSTNYWSHHFGAVQTDLNYFL